MAEMSKITSFKTFTQLKAEQSAAKIAEERSAKRGELKTKLAALLDEMDITSFEELDEETATTFINRAFGVVSEESEELGSIDEGAFQAISDPQVLMTIAASLAGMTGLYNADKIAKVLKSGGKKAEKLVKEIGKDSKAVAEGNAFIYAAAKAKAQGKDEFEFNGKTYKVTLKADTGLKESEEVSESAINEAKLNKADTTKIAQKIADIFTQESADAKEFFKYVVSNAGGGVSPMSFDLDVEKTAKTPKKYADNPNHFGEYAGGSFVIKDEDNCWCVYNAAMGMAHIEKFSKDGLKLIESTEYVSEAVIVTGKRDANRVMKAYVNFFKKYPALGPNAMGVPAMHHVGAIKQLYTEAMIDANFSRELPATKGAIKGIISPIDVKIADLNNATIRISASKLMNICAQNGSIISGAAKYSGLAIVEGTALYLDSLNHGKYAEDLMAKFNATFESAEAMEARLAEGNAFSTARLKAIEAGKDEFEFDGKTYPLKSVDKEDKELAQELTESETLDDYNQALEISKKYAIPVATAMAMVASIGVAAAVSLFKKGKRVVSKWVDKNLDESFIIEGAKEEQDAMELYTQVAGPDGKYTEDELAKADMDTFIEIVTAAGHKGSKAKKVADEFRKIATMEAVDTTDVTEVLCEATVEMDAMDPDNKDFVKFLKKNKVKIISKEEGPSGHPVIVMQGKRKDLETVLADEELGWADADLAEYIEESMVNETEVKSDEEFKEYAETVLQKAFGEDYDEAKAMEVIDGLISKHGEDYGAMVGALQSSLG